MAKHLQHSLLLTAMLIPAFTQASENEQHMCDNTVTEQCLPHTGWYIGGFIGSTDTDVNKGRLNQLFGISNTNSNSLNIDDDGSSLGLSAGYRFDRNIAIEVSYYDFGTRDLTFQGPSADIDRFANQTVEHYPASGDGLAISGLYSYPLNHQWSITGRLGIFDWEQEFSTTGVNSRRVDSTRDGIDVIVGAELSYHWRRNTQFYIGFDTVEMGPHRVNNSMLGLRFFFGGSDKPQPKLVEEPEVVEPITQPQPEAEKDSDKDGVFDSKDQCPNSEPEYQVDQDGCTIIEEVEQKITLNVLFNNDSTEVPKQSYADIAALAEFMKTHTDSSVVIEGHTSSQGPANYNQKLSEKRAQAVVKMLTDEFAIAADRLSAVGYGESRLLSDADTAEAHSNNRRIEANITVMTKAKKSR